MAIFKVGDKVRVLSAGLSPHLVGKVVPVIGVSAEQVYLEGSLSYWEQGSSSLELVEEKTAIAGAWLIELNSVYNTLSRTDWMGTGINQIKINKQKGVVMQAVDFVKRQALKVSNPDEFSLREAGLHNECGDLTDQGEELRNSFLEELVKEKMVTTARAILAEREKK